MSQNEKVSRAPDDLAAELHRIRSKNQSLENEIKRIRARGSALIASLRWFVRFFFGSSLRERGRVLANQVRDWQEGKRQRAPLSELVEVGVAGIARFVRVGLIGLLIATIPGVILIVQTWLLGTQNAKLELQNSLITFDQTTRFRELLLASARRGAHSPNDLSADLWHEPCRATVVQIAMLADSSPQMVAQAIAPLVSDHEGAVAAGAVLALRDILLRNAHQKRDLRPLLPDGDNLPVCLNDVCLEDEDLTVFSGTRVFRNARFERSLLRSVDAAGLDLQGARFSHATIECSVFQGADLLESRWNRAVVRSTRFDGANMCRAYLYEASFEDGLGIADWEYPPCGTRFDVGGLIVADNAMFVNLSGVNLQEADLRLARLPAFFLSGMRVGGALVYGTRMGRSAVTPAKLEAVGVIGAEFAVYTAARQITPSGGRSYSGAVRRGGGALRRTTATAGVSIRVPPTHRRFRTEKASSRGR